MYDASDSGASRASSPVSPDRGRPALRLVTAPRLYFDLASPHTYLIAERAERALAGVDFRPAAGREFGDAPMTIAEREAIHAEAAKLGLPLLWPLEVPAVGVSHAMRVAQLAARRGCCSRFVIAATRLMFCGNYDLGEPKVLVEAGDAAGLRADDVLGAAFDERHDAPIMRRGRQLLAAGAQVPAISIGGRVLSGPPALAAAVAITRDEARARRTAAEARRSGRRSTPRLRSVDGCGPSAPPDPPVAVGE